MMDLTWLAQIAAAWVLLIPSAAAATVATVVATDWVGIAAAIGGIGLITGQLFTYLTARKAAAAAAEAKTQSVETAKAVDGRMTEVVKLVGEKAAAEATLVEKAAREVRDAAVVLAVAPSVIAAAAKNGHPVAAKAKKKPAVKK